MLLELMWRPTPPSSHNSEGKQGVGQSKNPGRSLVEHHAMHPVLSEAALVHTLPRLHAQPVFERGKRAFNAQPTFNNDH